MDDGAWNDGCGGCGAACGCGALGLEPPSKLKRRLRCSSPWDASALRSGCDTGWGGIPHGAWAGGGGGCKGGCGCCGACCCCCCCGCPLGMPRIAYSCAWCSCCETLFCAAGGCSVVVTLCEPSPNKFRSASEPSTRFWPAADGGAGTGLEPCRRLSRSLLESCDDAWLFSIDGPGLCVGCEAWICFCALGGSEIRPGTCCGRGAPKSASRLTLSPCSCALGGGAALGWGGGLCGCVRLFAWIHWRRRVTNGEMRKNLPPSSALGLAAFFAVGSSERRNHSMRCVSFTTYRNLAAGLGLHRGVFRQARDDVQAHLLLAHRQFEIVAAVDREQVRGIHTRLLLHLAQRAVALGLVLVNLSLGKRPRGPLGPALDEHTLCEPHHVP